MGSRTWTRMPDGLAAESKFPVPGPRLLAKRHRASRIGGRFLEATYVHTNTDISISSPVSGAEAAARPCSSTCGSR
jgi:hypothetical protein